jgi:hypothetical protein
MLKTQIIIVEIANQVIFDLTASHMFNLTIIETNGSNIKMNLQSAAQPIFFTGWQFLK